MSNTEDLVCSLCRYPGSDLRFLGCGCTVHAMCAPLSLILDPQGSSQQEYGAFPPPNCSQSTPCPICKTGMVNGLYLVPLSFRDLERAVELRKVSSTSALHGKSGATNQSGRKHSRDESSALDGEATYMLLSNNDRSSLSGMFDKEQQRTGRWTEEEIAFVDYLVSSFDEGSLPLPHGIKLNEFLSEMLICKSSRLTKKMKNAKLSTRSFSLNPQQLSAKNDFASLSRLQEKFLLSVSSDSTQLELRFNLTKQWRTHFSNLCVQIGYPFLNGKDWISSLEEMDRRASSAEDTVRKARRRRMGLALQTDGGAMANPSVFIAGIKADGAATSLTPVLPLDTRPATLENVESNAAVRKFSSVDACDRMGDGEEDIFSMLGLNSNGSSQQKTSRPRIFSDDSGVDTRARSRTFSEDFDAVLNDLMDSEPAAAPLKIQTAEPTKQHPPSHACGPFLDAIVAHMENKKLPFHHADVWVPSFLPHGHSDSPNGMDTEQLRLFHAGYTTREDIDESIASSFREFGVYSDNFSFEPGHGLPGRVYLSGKTIWESALDECDPKIFERAGGAKVYGVKTAVGFPLKTPLVGRIIVVLYSRDAVPVDMEMASELARELGKYSPEPKWKLVIELNTDSERLKPLSQSGQSIVSNAVPPLNLPLTRNMSSSFSTQLGGCASPSATTNIQEEMDEHRIISLLGEHMPLSESSAGESSSSSVNSSILLPHFMSIRLLLLRPTSRRTTQENEMIDILKNSFRAYSKDNRRTGAELATLLAKDWVCLKSTFDGAPSLPPALPSHKNDRRVSTGSNSSANTPRAAGSLLAPPPAGPMAPPSQFASPSSMGLLGQNIAKNFPPGSMNALREVSSANMHADSTFRRNSFEGSLSGSRGQNSQPTIQPHLVTSSHPEGHTNDIATHPNVVVEH